MFHFNPHLLHQLECSWNFKNNFCTDAGNVCAHAEEHGAGAVHGITSAFFGDVNPTFRALYEGKSVNRLNYKYILLKKPKRSRSMQFLFKSSSVSFLNSSN